MTVKFTAPANCLTTITDLRLNGQSVIAHVRAEMLADGRLEDADDAITLFPGDTIDLPCDTIEWLEEPRK